MVIAYNLNKAIKYINQYQPEIFKVDIKSYVRIKRDIEQSVPFKPTSYSSCIGPFEKWAWHNLRAMRKQAKLMVMGIEIIYK